jgi:hypothetical protein
MRFFSWKTIVKDVKEGATLPAGMSRQALILGNVMPALHEAFPKWSIVSNLRKNMCLR